jgi:hypothetical protein
MSRRRRRAAHKRVGRCQGVVRFRRDRSRRQRTARRLQCVSADAEPEGRKTITRAKYVASFIGNAPGKALFIGRQKKGKSKPLTREQFWKVPAYIELKKLGMLGMSADRTMALWFDLAPMDFRSD